MAGCRVNRRVATIVSLVIVAFLLSQLFKYGPVSNSDRVQDKNNEPKSVLHDETNSILQEPGDDTRQMNADDMPNAGHQNQLLDTPSKALTHSEHTSDPFHRQESIQEDMERYSPNHPQTTKEILYNSHMPADSDANLHQKFKTTDTHFSQHDSPQKSKLLPVHRGFNTSSAFDPIHLPQSTSNSTRLALPEDPSANTELSLVKRVGDHTETAGSTKDSCSSFYEEVAYPTFQPVPVCGSKDYPMHTVHCYQSVINVGPYKHRVSLSKTTMKNNDLAVGMGITCTFQNIAVNGQNVLRTLHDCTRNCDIRSSKSLFLLDGKQSQCPIPTIALLMNKTDQHDYTRNFVQELLMLNGKQRLDPSHCGQWINKTALFFIANEPYNVYFQFLTYYNVFLTMNLLSSTQLGTFKGLMSFKNDPREFALVRLSNATDYRFGDFEQNLFPQQIVLSHLGHLANDSGDKDNNITCFQRVIKVPWAYSAFPFRSIVDSRLKNETLRCYNTVQNPARVHAQSKLRNGLRDHTNILLTRQAQTGAKQHISNRHLRFATERSQTDTVVPSMMNFRSLVLKACGIKESIGLNKLQARIRDNLKVSLPRDKVVVKQKFPLQVVVIKRKPYLRHGLDHPNLFQRILSNEAEMITALTQNISRGLLNVTSAYMEELDICEQVRVAHNADVLVGVHGAGLVHSWWMKESGVLLELVPLTKLNRPTYKVLAGLTGRKYYSVILDNSLKKHYSQVSVSVVLELLHKITKEWSVST